MPWRGNMHRALFLVVALLALTTVPAHAQVSPASARGCLLIEAKTKERLDCFDKLYPPIPLRKVSVRSIRDCKHVIEEDERLLCYERFLQPAPSAAPPQSKPGSSRAAPPAPSSRPVARSGSSCPCGTGSVCTGPRGGRYCMTSGGNKRYLRR